MKRFISFIKRGFERHLALSTVLSVTAVVLAATFFIFRPLTGAWLERLERIESEKLKLARHQRLVSQKGDLLAELAEYETRFKAGRPAEEEVTTFLKQVEALLADAGLRVNNIRPMSDPEAASKTDMMVLMIEFTVEGEMSDWVNFLHAFASSSDLLDVRGMSLLRRRTGEGNLAISAEVTKTLFVG